MANNSPKAIPVKKQARTHCHLTKKAVLKAIEGSMGLQLKVAEKLGVNRSTISKWVARDKDVAAAFDAEKEKMLDCAESMLIRKISEGDSACIFFYLKCQGKARGYIERPPFDAAMGAANGVKSYIVRECSPDAWDKVDKVSNGTPA